jgi:hypothetical protein
MLVVSVIAALLVAGAGIASLAMAFGGNGAS